jgi:hypothetical protein
MEVGLVGMLGQSGSARAACPIVETMVRSAGAVLFAVGSSIVKSWRDRSNSVPLRLPLGWRYNGFENLVAQIYEAECDA